MRGPNPSFEPKTAGLPPDLWKVRQTPSGDAETRDNHYRQLFERSSEAILISARDGRLQEANPAAIRMFGLSESDPTAGVSVVELYEDPADRERLMAGFDATPDASLHGAEVRMRRRDGSVFVAQISSTARRDADGEVIGYQGFIRDITDTTQLGEALRSILQGTSTAQGAKFFRPLAEHVAAALGVRWGIVAVLDSPVHARTIAVWDTDGFAPDFEYDLEHTPCEQVAQLRACCHYDGVQAAFPEDDLARDMNVEGYIGAPLCDGAGNAIGLLVAMHDAPIPRPGFAREIVEIFAGRAGAELARMRSDAALREREDDHEREFEHVTDIVLSLDALGTVLSVSPSVERALGYGPAELIGRTLRELGILTPDSLQVARSDRDALVAGHDVPLNVYEFVARDGSRVYGEVMSSVVERDGEFARFLCVARNVTEQRQLEAQVRQAQKLEAMGTLAGGIAHDFNNLLAPIIGYANLSLDLVEPDSRLHEYQTQVVQAAQHAADLSRQILTFSRQTEQRRRPVSLPKLTSELVRLVRATLPTTITTDTRIDENCGRVLADPTQMRQILMNLCANAAHAMGEAGGQLIVEVRDEAVTRQKAAALNGLTPGPHVRLSVRDNGSGMDAATLSRIFDPFFTTKGKEEGTGLGLAVVHGIVKSHAGAIDVRSVMGEGTVFHVYVPCHVEEDDHADNAKSIDGGTERILLIDDGGDLSRLGAGALARLGYQLERARSGPAALAALGSRSADYDLVLLDADVPDKSTGETIRALRGVRPDIPIIAAIGSPDAGLEADLASGVLCAIVSKPGGLRTIAKTLRHCLDGK